MDAKEIQNRFEYHPTAEGDIMKIVEIRKQTLNLAGLIDGLMPDCREKLLSMTHLEEAFMWAKEGVKRNTKAPNGLT